MEIIIRKYEEKDIPGMIRIWNEVVEEGLAFPQTEFLTQKSGTHFFESQTWCGVAQNSENGDILGLYILHPNNIGRCGHIANASYAVLRRERGKQIGRKLVEDSLRQAWQHHFLLMQFNAVVATNNHAQCLYESLGFVRIGMIPKGFRMKDGHYEDIILYYYQLEDNEKGQEKAGDLQ